MESIYFKSLFVSVFLTVSLLMNAQTPAFPGAEGHGRYTTGGRGGSVVRVTTLADNASNESVVNGSLRWALQQASPKTIVFDVSGTIQLKQTLKTGKDNITIAGQTAPGNGICIAGYDFVINSNNIIIRFVRFRPGDESGGEPDGLGGMDKKNIIIDHCSVSWSVDECLSVYGMENMTVQWCIASEALRVSTHEKGTHGYGGNWGGNKASYHHNLIAHCESRVPRLGPRTSTQMNEYVDIRNNVFYNWAGEGCYGGEGMKVNMVNNYYKPGPATDAASAAVKYRIAKIGVRTTSYVTSNPDFAPMLHIWGKYFIDGNKVDGNSGVTADNWTNGVYAQQSNDSGVDNLWTQTTKDTIRLAQPLNPGIVSTHTADVAYQRVLDYAGCSLNRDGVDTRIISDVRNRQATFTVSGNKAGYINTPFDTKPAGASGTWSPWLPTVQVTVPLDSDGDGIPDSWEDAHGLNKSNAADGKTLNAEGYTNLEVYLNSLVEGIVQQQNQGALNAKEWNFSESPWPASSAAVATGTTINGLTNYSTGNKPSVGASSKTYTLDGTDYNFTYCFKFGETGTFNSDGVTPKSGILAFQVNGDASISVIGVHASNDGDARGLVVAAKNGNTVQEIGSFSVYSKNDASAPAGLAGNLIGKTFTYTGGPTTIFVYSKIGGVNLYLVKSTDAPVTAVLKSAQAVTSISAPAADVDKVVKTVKYYDMTGRLVTGDAKGILIEKVTYEDGTTVSQKILKY